LPARSIRIEVAPLAGIEGCLQCDPLKRRSQIVVNAKSQPRRRYTIAHELGHFLNEHRPTLDFGFACTAQDISHPSSPSRCWRRGGRLSGSSLRGGDPALRRLA
jgi:hypothetical protein